MSNSDVIYTQHGTTAWLTLNRPQAMNSISLSIIEQMNTLLPVIAADDNVRVLVLTGAGSAFCAGADLKEVLASKDLPPGEPDMLDRVCDEVMNPLRDFPKRFPETRHCRAQWHHHGRRPRARHVLRYCDRL